MDNDTTTEEGAPVFVIAFDVANLLLNLCSIFANALIIYVILKHGLQKALTHLFVVNWCLLDILHVMTSRGMFKWYNSVSDLYREIVTLHAHFCVYFATEIAVALLLIALLLKDTSRAIRQHHAVVLGAIWLATGAYCLASIFAKLDSIGFGRAMPLVFLAAYACLLVTTAAHLIACRCKKTETADADLKLRLTLAASYVGLFLLICVVIVILDVAAAHNLTLVFYVIDIAILVSESLAILNVYLMYRLDKRFRLCLHKTLKRGDKYGEDINFVDEVDDV